MASSDARPLVLVVDDYDDSREMTAEFLVISGFRVEAARDGHEALTKATSLLPDVILMDLSLPGVDGLEVTRRLKADPKTKHIRVVALTGFDARDHALDAERSGCDGYVTKPASPELVVAAIQKQLKG